MAEQTHEVEQEKMIIHSPKATASYESEEDHHDEHEDDESEAPTSMWEELDKEIHKLLETVYSKLHLESLLQEKPSDMDDKTAISTWLDKLIDFVKGNHHQQQQELKEEEKAVVYTASTRSVDVGGNDAVAKLERFKVKNLAAASDTVNTTATGKKK